MTITNRFNKWNRANRKCKIAYGIFHKLITTTTTTCAYFIVQTKFKVDRYTKRSILVRRWQLFANCPEILLCTINFTTIFVVIVVVVDIFPSYRIVGKEHVWCAPIIACLHQPTIDIRCNKSEKHKKHIVSAVDNLKCVALRNYCCSISPTPSRLIDIIQKMQIQKYLWGQNIETTKRATLIVIFFFVCYMQHSCVSPNGA